MTYGDTIKISTPNRPTGYTTANGVLTVPAGNDARIYVNDKLVWSAGGGSGLANHNIAPDAVTSVVVEGSPNRTYEVHWHDDGGGRPGASHNNQFPTLYGVTVPGGCYAGDHEHDKYGYTCPKEVCGGHMDITYEGPGDGPGGYDWHVRCDRCGSIGYRHWQDDYTGDGYDNSDDFCDDWAYACNNLPYNVWHLGCGYQQGEIVGIDNDNSNLHSCYIEYGYTPDSATVSNSGNCKFSIKLLNHQGVAYNNTTVQSPLYKTTRLNLIIKDNTVVYFKRP